MAHLSCYPSRHHQLQLRKLSFQRIRSTLLSGQWAEEEMRAGSTVFWLIKQGRRDLIQNILSTPKKQKMSKMQKVERVANGPQNSSSASGGLHPNPEFSGQHGSTTIGR
ncbi:hypothetical protein NE237_011969 [Protea cynaroides]|uniref:Uncharacterized protein n=1 Tax=Protea cynaroides TaxID=273540 RepID=A0A9Q0JX81_9MAGN|nr:hypothetical protein NE237_011969 [Protea cynaroides]